MEDYLKINNSLFKIFESVLLGDLRPNEDEAKRGFYSTQKIPNLIKKPRTIEEYEKGLEELFSFNPKILRKIRFFSKEKDFFYLKTKNNRFGGGFENHLEITFPEYFNATTELYYFLITNEAVRLLMGLKYYVNKAPNKEKKISLLYKALLRISIFISQAVDKINEQKILPSWDIILDFGEQKEKTFNYTYTIFILALVRLHNEIIHSFKPLVDDKEKSVFELLVKEVEFIDNNLLSKEIDHGLLILKANELIESELFDVINAKKVLPKLYEQKNFNFSPEKRRQAIVGLENRWFLYSMDEMENNLNMESLVSYINTELIVKEKIKDYNAKIEKYNTGHERYEEIVELISNIDIEFDGLLQNESGIENTIPRKLLRWLNEQKELYRNQYSRQFNVPIGNSESGNDFNNKGVDLVKQIEENKVTARNNLAFFSGYNVQQEKIMSDADFNRLLEYLDALIEKREVPKGIKKIRQIGLKNSFIRYTFYLLHKDFYTTNRIREEWIEFLHGVFDQFICAPSTTKTKFSEAPDYYNRDLKIMLGQK